MPYGKIMMDSGAEVEFEVKGPASGRVGKDGLSSNLQKKFSDIMDIVKETAESAHAGLGKINEEARPDEYSIKFGLKLTTGAKLVIAEAGSEGSFEVTLTWTSKP